MTEEELREKGYYLFGINQDMFVQVRRLKTDEILTIGQGREHALAKAAQLLAKEDE